MQSHMKLIKGKYACLILTLLPMCVILLIYQNGIQDDNVNIPVLIEKYKTKQVQLYEKTNQIKYVLQYQTTGQRRLCLDDNFKGCEYESCIFTRDSNMMPIEDFDAILFHEPQEYSNRKPPKKRNFFQKYIYFNHESPVRFPIVFKGEFYNLTITYRQDADIYFPYARVEKRKNELSLNQTLLSEQIINKTKLIAWVVSNCGSNGVQYRKKLYEELNKHIHVDVFGKCGNLTCPGRMSSECYQMIDNEYKFYLSFENSYCRDYLTEKTFNILNMTNIIPIVFGFNDYKHLVPPNSVINVDDFKTARDLADYLLFLDKNLEEYMRYMEWKKYYWINNDLVKEMCCNMCKKLHEPLQQVWYKSMETWSLGENNTVCPKYNLKWMNKN